MVAARLGCQSAMVGSGWANSCPCLSRCMTNMSADHCMLIHEWEWLRSSLLVQILKVDLGSVLESKLGLK